ncbi:MAG: NTP transferase domain-containing protein [Thermoproteota archaeon]
MRVLGLILAGGESRRFGADKLIALVNGRPSLSWVAEALAEAGAEYLLLASRDASRCRLYAQLAGVASSVLCVEDPRELLCGGPASALAGLQLLSIPAETVYVAPGDMPWLEPRIHVLLESYRRLYNADVAAPIHVGYIEPLLLALGGGFAAKVGQRVKLLCRIRGELRATDIVRVADRIALVGSSMLASTSRAFAHINTPDELRLASARNALGPEQVSVVNVPWRGDLEGLCSRIKGEAEAYTQVGADQLALHARRDLRYFCGGDGGS